jgi:hypothetical protein
MSAEEKVATRHIARWDLDKTYLRTEFDTVRDLVKTALERPDEKRTNPGASSLLREMVKTGVSVHILSGSPTQMRKSLEDKLRLDGIVWDSFTLKPNLKNVLRLRFRALRDQLGYKLPALLDARATKLPPELAHARETLFGDDAEADAFVYSLYGDVLSGKVSVDELARICERGEMYEDVLEHTLEVARSFEPATAWLRRGSCAWPRSSSAPTASTAISSRGATPRSGAAATCGGRGWAISRRPSTASPRTTRRTPRPR